MTDLKTYSHGREAAIMVIIGEVGRHHEILPAVLLSSDRTRRITDARRHVCYLMQELLGLKQLEISRRLGCIDHSSVRNAIERTEQDIKSNPQKAAEIEALIKKVENATRDSHRSLLVEWRPTRPDALEVARDILISPHGELFMCGADMRTLATAYVDLMVRQVREANG